jgi:hypothetical protein
MSKTAGLQRNSRDYSKIEIDSCLKMIGIFCRNKHDSDGELCKNCRELFEYVIHRIAICPFGTEKPVCSKCPIHCFHAEKRSRIIEVMRYSGPRMLYRHPLLALRHLLQAGRKPSHIANDKNQTLKK